MPVLDGNQAGDDGLSDARSLAASMRGGGGGDGEEEIKEGTPDDEDDEAVRILTFSRSGSTRRESILRQGMADLEVPELDAIDDAICALEIIRGGGRDSPTNSEQNKPVGFQPIPGMISPTGMMSPPPPMLMPTPVQGNPQQLNQLMLQMPQGGVAGAAGGGAEAQPAMAFTYVPVPVYNMSGVSLPGVAPPHSGTVSPIKTAAEDKSDGAKKQSEDSSDQVQQQQMYQQAFLQNAVAQNMQIQQQLLMQNQALTQLLQQSGPSSVSSATPMPSMMAPGMYPQPQDLSRPGSSSPAKATHGGDSVVEAMRRQDNQG